MPLIDFALPAAQDALRVRVTLREVRDGYCGALGTTLRMQDIAAFAHSPGNAHGAVESIAAAN